MLIYTTFSPRSTKQHSSPLHFILTTTLWAGLGWEWSKLTLWALRLAGDLSLGPAQWSPMLPEPLHHIGSEYNPNWVLGETWRGILRFGHSHMSLRNIPDNGGSHPAAKSVMCILLLAHPKLTLCMLEVTKLFPFTHPCQQNGWISLNSTRELRGWGLIWKLLTRYAQPPFSPSAFWEQTTEGFPFTAFWLVSPTSAVVSVAGCERARGI